ncbi:MAG: DNA polymerase, partial [Candidatus Diapherotrites archaeon]|nr:DNA polymerase [Candidatus Diapherotrites archaeon]
MEIKGVLLDFKDVVEEVNGKKQSVIKLFLKGDKSFEVIDPFEPFFYVIPKKVSASSLKTDIEAIRVDEKDGVVKAKRVEVVKKKYLGADVTACKVFCLTTKDVYSVRGALKEWKSVDVTSGFTISSEKKYLTSKALSATDEVTAVVENGQVKEITSNPGSDLKQLIVAAIDIEVFAKGEFPTPENNEVLMISYVNNKGVKLVFATKEIKQKFVVACKDEKDLFEKFSKQVNDDDVDVLMTYGGDRFDLPYLKKRSKVLKVKLKLGKDGSEIMIRPGSVPRAVVKGRVHVDVYHLARFFATIGVINLPRYKLERVYEHVIGKPKVELPGDQLWEYWSKDPELMAQYNLDDSIAALELGTEWLPTFVELSRLAGISLYRTTRMGTGSIAEHFLVKRAEEIGEIVPRRPKHDLVISRRLNPFQGGYVMEPEPGLKEDIVEYDFRSLYPTIITSHNISPETLEVKGCKDFFTSPVGFKFCKTPVGFIPLVLEDLLNMRTRVKKEMNTFDKKSSKYKELYAKQYALKIVNNSIWGYLGYPRGRWYSRECAESITAWAREFTKMTIAEAEKFGLKPLYADTDSLYAGIPKGWKKDKLIEFLDLVNSTLPEKMELELEGFYSRGLFVATKDGSGAKKKYALISK